MDWRVQSAVNRIEREKGTAGGYPSLDSAGKIPIAQVPTGATSSTVCIGNDSRLSDARTPLAHAHVIGDTTGLQTALDGKAATGHSHSLADITDEGALASKNTVATGDIDNDAVTYAKIQNVSAPDKVLGRVTTGAGDIEEIACTAAGRALIDDVGCDHGKVVAISERIIPRLIGC